MQHFVDKITCMPSDLDAVIDADPVDVTLAFASLVLLDSF